MNLRIEVTKLKRTGYVPAFLLGGLLSAAIPIVNTAARSEVFTALDGRPLTVLLNANWQMMTMLGILLAVCGACILYHTEFAGNAIQKMDTLPIRSNSLFLGKLILSCLASLHVILQDSAALALCIALWFPASPLPLAELAQFTGFELVMLIPTVTLTLVIASVCQNLWVSLGIGVFLAFTAIMFPQEHAILSLLPFSSPYQLLHTIREHGRVWEYLCAGGIETLVFGLFAPVCQKIRRCLR